MNVKKVIKLINPKIATFCFSKSTSIGCICKCKSSNVSAMVRQNLWPQLKKIEVKHDSRHKNQSVFTDISNSAPHVFVLLLICLNRRKTQCLSFIICYKILYHGQFVFINICLVVCNTLDLEHFSKKTCRCKKALFLGEAPISVFFFFGVSRGSPTMLGTLEGFLT